MLLRFCIVCTVLSICVTAQPSRLKILPGLAFYRTDDSHDEQDNSLMDKDKNLLRSMWNIVDKMDYKTQPSDALSNSSPNPTSSQERTIDTSRMYMSSTMAPLDQKLPERRMLLSQPGRGPQHGKMPPLGTPITTINVYSTYPGAAVKAGSAQYAAYHRLPPNLPYSASHNQNIIAQAGPRFEAPKFYGPPMNNPMNFEPSSPPQDGLMPPRQYDSGMNSNGMVRPFENPMERERDDGMERPGFDSGMDHDDMPGRYGGPMRGMDDQQGSEPMQFLMPPMGEKRSYMGQDMNMGADPLRHQLNF